MSLLAAVDAKIDRLESDLAQESGRIAADIAAKQRLADDYWKRRWQIENQLRAAHSVRAAIIEVTT